MEHDHVQRDEVVTLLSDLVAIDSVNPSLVRGARGEGDIAHFIARWLGAHGLEVDLVDVEPGRPNVIARVPGRSGGRSLMLNAHIDTVGTAGMERPFEPRVEGDRLYGRGAYDMKGGLAAIMLAGRAVARAGGAAGDVIVAAVMDEEYASLGTEAALKTTRPDAAVVTEPTGLRLCLAHKGFAWLTVETLGRAAHGSKPELGVDAIAHMGRFLVELEGLGRSLAARPRHPLLGNGSVHASLITGGAELSSYPERCRLQLERRTVPGETRAAVLDEIQEIVQRLQERDERSSATCELDFWREPFEVDRGEEVVRALSQSVTAVTGSSPAVYGDTPWMDAALLAAAGVPTVVFGPGGAGAHAVTEYASIAEVGQCAESLTRLALSFPADAEPANAGGMA